MYDILYTIPIERLFYILYVCKYIWLAIVFQFVFTDVGMYLRHQVLSGQA